MVTTATTLGQSSSLSPWAGPYVTEMLGRGAALASMPYQAYMGPLTAGASPLQQQAFSGLAGLAMPSTLTGAGMGYGGSSGFPTPPTYQPMQQPSFGGGLLFPAEGIKPGEETPVAGLGGVGSINMVTGERWGGPRSDEQIAFDAMSIPEKAQTLARLSTLPDQPTGRPIEVEGIGGTREIPYYMLDSFDPKPGASLQDLPLEIQQIAERLRPASQPGGLGGTAGMAQQQPMQQGAPTTQQQIASLMNPYIEQALNPQLEAAKRQAEIQAQQLQSQYGKAGAYGGSRQGVAEAEVQRGLLDRMAGLTGTGYQQAYDKAVDLLGKERGYGLDLLGAQRQAGAEQRGIEQQGIAADIAQFREERDYPYKQLQYMQSLLQGLPISTQTYQYAEPSDISQFMSGAGGILGLLDTMGLFD